VRPTATHIQSLEGGGVCSGGILNPIEIQMPPAYLLSFSCAYVVVTGLEEEGGVKGGVVCGRSS
jgi:hypothetical protein